MQRKLVTSTEAKYEHIDKVKKTIMQKIEIHMHVSPPFYLLFILRAICRRIIVFIVYVKGVIFLMRETTTTGVLQPHLIGVQKLFRFCFYLH